MIIYSEDWIWSTFFTRGGCAERSLLYTIPPCLISLALTLLEDFEPGTRTDYGLDELSKSQLFGATCTLLGGLLTFRAVRAYNRFWEGTGLLHQMRGEWFDTCSNCVSFSITAKEDRANEVMRFRHTLVRLMSLAHGSALEEISSNSIQLESIDTLGLDDRTLGYLQECHQEQNFNKVEVMLHLIQSHIVMALDKEIIRVPAPICSRVFQTISRGFVNLLNAKKIQDTAFPFPLAQLIYVLLVASWVVIPLLITSIVEQKVLVLVMTFLPTFFFFNMNFISVELEDPFGTDDNDLPLEHFQTEMNNCLMMLLFPKSDLLPDIRDNCQTDFYQLSQNVTTVKEEPSSSPTMSKPARKTVTPKSSNSRLDDFTNWEGSMSRQTTGDSAHVSGASEASAQEKEGDRRTCARHLKDFDLPPALYRENGEEAGGQRDTTSKASNVNKPFSSDIDDVGNVGDTVDTEVPGEAEPYPNKVAQHIPRQIPQLGSRAIDVAEIVPTLKTADPATSQIALSQANESLQSLVAILQKWARHVEKEVEHLLVNSNDLRQAISKLSSGLPAMILNNPVTSNEVQLVMSSVATELSLTVQSSPRAAPSCI